MDGQRVRGVADDVVRINGKLTAVEAKYGDDGSQSLRNPESPGGSKPWAVGGQQQMLGQARKCSSGFEGGVVYHTNSVDLANYYTKIFENAWVKGFKFIITPSK